MSARFLYIILVLCSLFFLASCADWVPPLGQSVLNTGDSSGVVTRQDASDVLAADGAKMIVDAKKASFHHELTKEETIVVQTTNAGGTSDSVVVEPKPIGFIPRNGVVEEQVLNDDQHLSLSVEGMELNSFIHLVYGKYLKVNYMVDPQIDNRKDSVSIHMQEDVSPRAFKNLINELLKKYNIVARKRKGVVFVESVKSQGVTQEDFVTIVGRNVSENIDDDQLVLLFAPVSFTGAKDVVQVLRQMYPEGSRDILSAPGNALMIKNRAGQVRKMLQLIALLDQPYMQDQHVRLLALDYIKPEDLIKRLSQLLPSLAVPVAKDRNEPGIKLLEMPEISSLLIISPVEKWLRTIVRWVDKLDTPAVLGPEPRIFIYKPHFRKAENLAKIILGLRNDSSSSGIKQDISPKKSFNNEKATLIEKEPPKAIKTGASVLRTAELTITIDEPRNTLVVFTTPAAYEEIEKNLKMLDVMARQVLIEVTLAEVTLTGELQYGVEWYLTHQGDNGITTLSTFKKLELGGSGVLGSFMGTVGGFSALINAFAKDSLVNILSNPHLVVLDNETASFSVGTDVPVVTSEATADDIGSGSRPSVLRNIQYRKTGVILSIKPTIFSNGILRLDIDQTVSEAQKNTVSPDTGSPLILDRSLTTSVVLKSGQSVLIAGIIANSKSSGDQRIPFLGDIPWLGNLFKTTSSQTTKTELMIQVRPIILDSPEQARIETLRFERTLRQLKELNSFIIEQ